MKDLLVSKTALGTLFAALAIVLGQFGYTIGDPEGFANDVAALAALAFALYGRAVAIKPIGTVAGVKIKKT